MGNNSELNKQTTPINFNTLSDDVKVILFRGLAQQILMLSFPKLSVIDHHFSKVGLRVISEQALHKMSEAVDSEAMHLHEEVKKVADKVAGTQGVINRMKLILINKTYTQEEQLKLIKELLEVKKT